MLIHLSTLLNFTYVFSSLTGKKSWAGFFQKMRLLLLGVEDTVYVTIEFNHNRK